MIGVDDMWDVVADSDSALYAPARALAVRLDVDPELLWPLLRGLGPTPLASAAADLRTLSAPIDAARSAPRGRTPTARERCATRSGSGTAGIADLQAERELDPARRLAPRLWGEAKRLTQAQATELRRILHL